MNIIEKKKRQMGQGGFTLIELLVVIAILAVLAGLAVIGIGAMLTNAEKSACKADRDTVETAAEAWSLDDANSAATTVDAGDLVAEKYLKKGIDGTDFTATRTGDGAWTAVNGTAAGDKYEDLTDCA